MTPAELTVLEGLEADEIAACAARDDGNPESVNRHRDAEFRLANVLRKFAPALFAALREAWKRAEQFRDSRGYHVLTSDEWAAAQGDKADAERLTYLRFYIDLCSLPNESPEADAVRDKMDRFRSGVYGCLRDAMGKVCAAFDDAELFRRIERERIDVEYISGVHLTNEQGRTAGGPDLRTALAALPEVKP